MSPINKSMVVVFPLPVLPINPTVLLYVSLTKVFEYILPLEA